MSAIAWDTVENAVQLWVRQTTGLADANVVWEDLNPARPSLPYVSLLIEDVGRTGQDWKVYDDAPDPAPGAELRVRARGLRTAKLTIRCFGKAASGNTPLRILSDALSGLELHIYDLDLAGVGIGDIGIAQMVPGGRQVLEPNARAEVALHLASELESRDTYIERVQTTVHAKQVDGVTTLTDSEWTPDPPP